MRCFPHTSAEIRGECGSRGRVFVRPRTGGRRTGRPRRLHRFVLCRRSRKEPHLGETLAQTRAKVTSAPGGGLFAAGWWEDIDILRILLRAGAPIDVVVGVT